MNIVFDIDDTLMTVEPLLTAAMNAATGKSLTALDIQYDYGKAYGLSNQDLFEIWTEHQVLEKATWSGDKKEFNRAVWNWAAAGHDVFLCTARGWHDDALKITNQHLAMDGEIPCKLLLVKPFQSKLDALRIYLEKPDHPMIFVDDNVRHLGDARRASATTIKMVQPWNGHYVLNDYDVYDQTHMLKAVQHVLETFSNGDSNGNG